MFSAGQKVVLKKNVMGKGGTVYAGTEGRVIDEREGGVLSRWSGGDVYVMCEKAPFSTIKPPLILVITSLGVAGEKVEDYLAPAEETSPC